MTLDPKTTYAFFRIDGLDITLLKTVACWALLMLESAAGGRDRPARNPDKLWDSQHVTSPLTDGGGHADVIPKFS